MLKDAQKSEQMADMLASRMNKSTEPAMSESPAAPKVEIEVESAKSEPEGDGQFDDLLKGLSENDKQQLLSQKPKSVTDRVLRDALMKQQGKATQGE